MATQPTPVYPWIHGFTTSGDLNNLDDVLNSNMDAYGNPKKPGSIHLDFVEGSFEGKPASVTTEGSVKALGSYYNNATGQSVPASCVWSLTDGKISATVRNAGGTLLAEVPPGAIVRGKMALEVK